MEFKDITERLTEEQKKRLKEVKTEDDLKKLMLEDEQLKEITGGAGGIIGCFQPNETTCACCRSHKIFNFGRCSDCGFLNETQYCPYCHAELSALFRLANTVCQYGMPIPPEWLKPAGY